MPLLPTAFLDSWLRLALGREKQGTRIALFTVSGQVQPTLCLLHREVLPCVADAVRRGAYKLYPTLEKAARYIAVRNSAPLETTFFNLALDQMSASEARAESPIRLNLTEAQREVLPLWFANVNTPGDLAEAERLSTTLTSSKPRESAASVGEWMRTGRG